MSNLSLLIKTNIINEFNLNKSAQLNKKEKNKFILLALGIVVFLGYLIWQMFEVCFMASDILIKSNILDLMIVGSFASAILLCLFTTLYKSSSYLFSSKDFDILSSLPLKDSDVLISKIFMLFISNYLFSLPIIFIPGIVYGINTNSSVVYYLYLILMSICVPLIPMVISSIISFGLGKISSKVKYKNIILISGSIILMILYFIVVSKIQDVGIALIENNKSVTEAINKIYFITKYFVDALVNLNFIYMIKFLGISIGIFALFIKVFAKPFKIINSEMREAHKNKTSKIIKVKSDKVITSLLKKEVVRYFSSYMYVLNSSIGMILLPLFAISIFLLEQTEYLNY